jgi:hypothetical protein
MFDCFSDTACLKVPKAWFRMLGKIHRYAIVYQMYIHCRALCKSIFAISTVAAQFHPSKYPPEGETS